MNYLTAQELATELSSYNKFIKYERNHKLS